jgi:molybdate transport system regulatory protein
MSPSQPTSRKVRSQPLRRKIAYPSVRFRIDFGAGRAIGPGKIALLEQIERCGSLSQAARNLNLSYRRAWQLLDSLNSCFVEPVARTSKGGRGGGGATLTLYGERLIHGYRAFDVRIQAHAVRYFGPFKTNVPKKKARAANRAPIIRLSDR